MRALLAISLFFFSTLLLASPEEDFKRDIELLEKNGVLFLQYTFNNNPAKPIRRGLSLQGKPDKHIHTRYTITDINDLSGSLTIEYTKTIDMRSFGESLKTENGSFSFTYK